MKIESGTSQCPRLYNVILAGPQHREFRKEILQAMPVGDNEFNFVKISFLSHSLCMNLIMYSYF
ncbi:hypothetical protein ACR78_01400 [Staphylococcus aureus]|nr:hypothetical protein ACR78_01400 [Staphylococcus aureus]